MTSNLEDKFESRIGWSLVSGASGGDGVMATMHAYLRKYHSDTNDLIDTILYGPLTSNQVTRFELVDISILTPREPLSQGQCSAMSKEAAGCFQGYHMEY